MSHQAHLYVALTADVDPDANRPARGRIGAVSPGAGDGVSLDGALEGLGLLADIKADDGPPWTLFWEGRTLEEVAERRPELLDRLRRGERFAHGSHGMHHEDFAGRDTGVSVGPERTRSILWIVPFF